MSNIYEVTAFRQILERLGFKPTTVEYIRLQGFKTMLDLVATAETKGGAGEEKSGDDQPTATGTTVPIIFPYLAVWRLQALCVYCEYRQHCNMAFHTNCLWAT